MENNDTLEVIQRIPLDKLRPYPDHPFGVRDNDMMQQTVESIKGFDMIFTNDELNLMCIYDTGTRTGLIEALSTMREQLEADETELLQMTDSAIKKLRTMTDEDY